MNSIKNFITRIKERFKESSFVVYILLICIIPQLIIIYLTYGISESGLRKEMESKLNIVADNKIIAVDNYIFNAQNEAKILAYNPDIVQAVLEMSALPPSESRQNKIHEIAQTISPYVAYFMALNGYDSIYFISPKNELLFSLSKDQDFKVETSQNIASMPELSSVVDRAKILMETEISNFLPGRNSNQERAFMAAPIISQGDVIGILALQLNIDEISKIINASIGSNISLENIVGITSPSSSEVQLMLPLKFDKDKQFLDQSNPADKATYEYFLKSTHGGNLKSSIFNDYRGQSVISVARYIPSLRWGMITKIDTDEAFSYIQQLRRSILWLLGLSFPLLIFILYKVSKTLQRSKELLDNIINSMPSQMIIFDESGHITLWNNEAEKLSGMPLEETKEKPLAKVLPQLETAEQKIYEAILTKEPQKIDRITYTTPEGDVYYEALTYPLAGRGFNGTALLVQDITDRVQLMDSVQQQDRLASIGLLVAGVAHEINNPLNFITSNVKSLRNDINDILVTLKMYSNINAQTTPNVQTLNAELKKIDAYKDEVDLKYTVEEIDKLLKGMDEGAQRTSTIVKGLKTFSRADDSDMVCADIIEGIESTLTLLKNSYKHRIDVVKDYEPDIPPIDCYPGKLNQVFMNILSNAIQAIPDKGTIYIKISKGINTISISIRDTGIGIKEEYKHKILMPFFTTKDVGQGTGLGLSITYNIILDHHGTLVVNSEEGKGAEFIITLPIKQPIPKLKAYQHAS